MGVRQSSRLFPFTTYCCLPEVVLMAASDWLNYNNLLALTTWGLVLSASTARGSCTCCAGASAALRQAQVAGFD